MKEFQRYAAEILGTFVLVFGGCATIIAYGNASAAPFGFGLALLAGLYAFGDVSGGHFNPAVSLGMFIDRRLNFADMIGYWLSQFLGAIVATLVLRIVFSSSSIATAATVPGRGTGKAILFEIVFTAIFLAVILHSTKNERVRGTALLAIPFTLMMIHFGAVPISGASVNPARTIATALVGSEWKDIWVYIVGPAAGAVLGWLAFAVATKGDVNPLDRTARTTG